MNRHRVLGPLSIGHCPAAEIGGRAVVTVGTPCETFRLVVAVVVVVVVGTVPPPPPCAGTAAVPKVQSKQRFNAHTPVAKTRPCVRATHTRRQSAVRDGHAGGSHVSHTHHNKPHGLVMWGALW